jgi:hypothetical protein
MNSNWILYRNESIIMLGNQTDNIVNVGVNGIIKDWGGGQEYDTLCMSL